MKAKATATPTPLPKRLENDLAGFQPIADIPQYTRIKHFANLGDAIAMMAAMKRYYEVTGRKIIFSQQKNQLAQYYQGANHGTKNSAGEMVCMNDAMFNMLLPLVESQEYIHKMEAYEGQHVDLDFDVIRGKTFVNLPHGMIQSWVMYAFPDLACDLSKPWIKIEGDCPKHIKKQVSGKVIINFTERYRNSIIDYFFLKNYTGEIIFAGTETEHFKFCHQWQVNVPRLEVNNFLELAHAIKEAKFLLANQSFCWGIAEAMKTPRVLEVCNFAVNCMPFVGEESYGYYHQVGAEYYFRTMLNKKASL